VKGPALFIVTVVPDIVATSLVDDILYLIERPGGIDIYCLIFCTVTSPLFSMPSTDNRVTIYSLVSIVLFATRNERVIISLGVLIYPLLALR
jgi:hypothetical protein